MNHLSNPPKLSIGLPVYNGEKFIKKKLISLLSSNFHDFELIISDNFSTDNTKQICQEFAKKDERIKFFQQSENIGIWKNFAFVLQQANSNYFMWTSVDDNILPGFFEKNIHILESDSNIVCSISQVERYGSKIDMFLPKTTDSFIQKIYKQFRRHFRTYGAKALTGTFEQKAGKFLRHSAGQSIYGVFKTNQLKDSIKNIWGENTEGELFLFLNILRYGDLHVLDEVLLNCWDGGYSSQGFIGSFRQKKISFFELVFPFYHHFIWCAQNVGIKFIIKNLDHWMWLTSWPLIMIPKEALELFKKKIK
jgi:glycosyltransferase involved in cell wall biosynthesis